MRHKATPDRYGDVVILESRPKHHASHHQNPATQLPNMSYGKKDEDADLGLVRVDRTQVFQEGLSKAIPLSSPNPPPS